MAAQTSALEVTRFIPGGDRDPEGTRQRVAELIAHHDRHGFSKWAVTLSDSGLLIGDCGLQFLPGRPALELGFHIARAHWLPGLNRPGSGGVRDRTRRMWFGHARKFDPETRDRAVRMYEDRIAEFGDSKRAPRRHVGELLGINQATLRNWVEDRHGGGRPAASAVTASAGDKDAELAAPRREVADLRRANEILKTASAFFAAAEVDRRLR